MRTLVTRAEACHAVAVCIEESGLICGLKINMSDLEDGSENEGPGSPEVPFQDGSSRFRRFNVRS